MPAEKPDHRILRRPAEGTPVPEIKLHNTISPDRRIDKRNEIESRSKPGELLKWSPERSRVRAEFSYGA